MAVLAALCFVLTALVNRVPAFAETTVLREAMKIV